MCRAEQQRGRGPRLPGPCGGQHLLGACPGTRQKRNRDHSCLFFTSRETEAQRAWVTCPDHRQAVAP